MAASLRCPKKAARRARHFELAGLATAAKYFQHRAEMLGQAYKKEIDPQSDLLIDNLNKFNEFVEGTVEKWEKRRPGEIWTRRGGQRVTKRPDGTIVPYFGPKEGRGKEEEEEKGPGGRGKRPKKPVKKGEAVRRTLLEALNIKKGPGGALISGFFSKSEEALARLVRAYLATQEEKSKHKESDELTKEQKANSNYMKFNKGINQAEKMARKYGERGLVEHDKKDTNEPVCRFLLASCLVFADLATAMGRRRDSSE
jgi:hypothetical protein